MTRKNNISTLLAGYKKQLKDTPKYKIVDNPELVVFQKQIYDMNPVYFNLMGKIELAEKLLIDLSMGKKQ